MKYGNIQWGDIPTLLGVQEGNHNLLYLTHTLGECTQGDLCSRNPRGLIAASDIPDEFALNLIAVLCRGIDPVCLEEKHQMTPGRQGQKRPLNF